MGKCRDYTERVDGFQIRDVTYFGRPPKDEPIKFAVVKWRKTEPREMTVITDDWKVAEKKLVDEFCYVVGFLVWDDHEPGFWFKSVGLRWLEEKHGEAVTEMILKFCAEKEREILDEEDRL